MVFDRRTTLPTMRRWIVRLLAAIGLLAIVAIATPLDLWWARAYSGPIREPRGEILILLSAAYDDHGAISYSSYWRARYALRAWQSGGFRTIVIDGGGGPGILDYLVAEGVPRQAIVAEWSSTSTRENAQAALRLTQGMTGRRVLLTSDFHMYRALRVFRRAGLQVTPMPVPDVLKEAQHWNGRVPGLQTLLIETTKIVYYKLRGWI